MIATSNKPMPPPLGAPGAAWLEPPNSMLPSKPPATPPASPCQNGLRGAVNPDEGPPGEPGMGFRPGVLSPGEPVEGLDGIFGVEKLRLPRPPDDPPPPALAQALDSIRVNAPNRSTTKNRVLRCSLLGFLIVLLFSCSFPKYMVLSPITVEDCLGFPAEYGCPSSCLVSISCSVLPCRLVKVKNILQKRTPRLSVPRDGGEEASLGADLPQLGTLPWTMLRRFYQDHPLSERSVQSSNLQSLPELAQLPPSGC